MPERRVRGGAGQRGRARQLPEGAQSRHLPDQAGRAVALAQALLLEAEDLG